VADRAWYRADPGALDAVVGDALVVQPHMRLDDDGTRVLLRGRFEIREGATLLEAFAMDVQLAPESARHPPAVWETGERIPRVRDPHHVNVDADGSLCVLLPDAYWFHHPHGLSLAEFLQGPLRDHLAGQAVVLQGGGWPNGAWSHFTEGATEFYREVLRTEDDRVLSHLLASELTQRSKRRMRCPCGSGRLRRHCHGDLLRRLRKGPNFEAVYNAARRGAHRDDDNV
jgi:hypothetical protein